MHRFSTLKAMLGVAVVLSLGCGSGSESITSLPQSELTRSKELWSSKGIHSYRFTLQRGCFCSPDVLTPVVIEVHGDTTTSITKVGGGTVDGTAFASYNTIDKIFTAIQNTLDIHGNVNATTYHTTQGYPIQVDLDPHPNLADDEESLQVSDFQVL